WPSRSILPGSVVGIILRRRVCFDGSLALQPAMSATAPARTRIKVSRSLADIDETPPHDFERLAWTILADDYRVRSRLDGAADDLGLGIRFTQSRKKLLAPARRNRYKQTASRLWVIEQMAHLFADGLGDRDVFADVFAIRLVTAG